MPSQIIPVVALELAVEVIRQGLGQSWGELRERFFAFVREFVAAIPYPLAMADAVVGFSTSVFGYLSTAPMLGLKAIALERVRGLGIANRLIRVDTAISKTFDTSINLFRFVTLSSESGLWSVIATGVGRFLWRFVKKVKFLTALIRADNEAQFIAAIVESVEGKVRRLKIGILILGTAALVVFAAFTIFAFGFILSIGSFAAAVLPQDSKRIYARPKIKIQRRINVRTGPDRTQQ